MKLFIANLIKIGYILKSYYKMARVCLNFTMYNYKTLKEGEKHHASSSGISFNPYSFRGNAHVKDKDISKQHRNT